MIFIDAPAPSIPPIDMREGSPEIALNSAEQPKYERLPPDVIESFAGYTIAHTPKGEVMAVGANADQVLSSMGEFWPRQMLFRVFSIPPKPVSVPINDKKSSKMTA